MRAVRQPVGLKLFGVIGAKLPPVAGADVVAGDSVLLDTINTPFIVTRRELLPVEPATGDRAEPHMLAHILLAQVLEMHCYHFSRNSRTTSSGDRFK